MDNLAAHLPQIHMTAQLIRVCLGFAPVLIFLLILIYMDSFKLVGFFLILEVLLWGAVAAGLSYLAAGPIMDAAHMDITHYSRYLAPLVEEGFKAALLVWLFTRDRIGFMIDAAILGVAVGAGFALAENIYYAYLFSSTDIGLWMVRGLGTAIMHSGVSAVFAVTAQTLRERHNAKGLFAYLPGYLIAASLHSMYNQFQVWPIYSTAGTLIILPLALVLVFDKSEHQMHNWLIQDYETHHQLLEDIDNGAFANSHAGALLKKLATRFSATMAAKLFAYIKLHTQLVLRAEEILLAKERGETVPVGRAEHDAFKRMHMLEKEIGRTAMLTLWPHLKFSHQELFELHQLEARVA